MLRFVAGGVVGGLLFGIMDGIIHANPFARRLFQVYEPLARTSVNVSAGVVIDLAYGFLLAALFVMLYDRLPGGVGLVKGVTFAVIVWLLRVGMGVASQWMMFVVPARTLVYVLVAGLAEMLILGLWYGALLTPRG